MTGGSEVGSRNAEVGRKKMKWEVGIVRFWISECGLRIETARRRNCSIWNSDPSSSLEGGTMPRQACGSRKEKNEVGMRKKKRNRTHCISKIYFPLSLLSSDICHRLWVSVSKKRWSWLASSSPHGQSARACSKHSMDGKSR